MTKRLLFSIFVIIVVALGTVALWQSLRSHNETQIARLVEAQSWAARSHLVRNLESLMSALHNLHSYWSTNGHLPPDQWSSSTGLELERFSGVELVLWDDISQDIRFKRPAKDKSFHFRPDDSAWAAYADFLNRARLLENDTIYGPFLNDQGQAYFEVYLVGKDATEEGRLIAVINANNSLREVLREEPPGYSIAVHWKELRLIQLNEPASGIPESWVRTGRVRTPLNNVWTVVSAPTSDLAATLTPKAIDATLVLGLVVAVLMGALTFENGRTQLRARDAERAEHKVVELNQNLEQEIRLQTQELANRTEDLETLTDSVAHDLRNPLNAISVNVELLSQQQLQSDASSEPSPALQRISGSVQQMTNILERLVNLSMVSHSTFTRERLDMTDIFKKLFHDLLASETDKDVEFQLADLPVANADERLVKMLVMNLLGNALKFTRGKEKRRIRVTAEQRDKHTVYSVHDNGVGFDEAASDQLFKAFQKAENNKHFEGIGLGLTIAARTVERHKGRIWAQSAPGQGAIFSFTLEA